VPPHASSMSFSHSDWEQTEGKEKTAEYAGSYIRDKLREVSFARKILPPEQVTRVDCQRSVITILW